MQADAGSRSESPLHSSTVRVSLAENRCPVLPWQPTEIQEAVVQVSRLSTPLGDM